MAEIRINATGGVKLYDADDSHYAQILAGTISSNVDVLTLGSSSADFNIPVKVLGTTPTLTIGDAGAEDTKIVYDGNAKDFYIALDDSSDKLVIGEGSTVGTNSILTITDDSVTIGDAAAVDTKIVFDGNAQDFYIGLDDSADDLVIGLGSAVGTTPAISINEDRDVTISDGAIDFDIASHDTSNGLKLGGTLVTATAAELNIMDGVTSTAAEINLIDGGTARGTTALADGDGVLINDGGTMRMTTVQTVKTYMGFAASDITGGTDYGNIPPATGDSILMHDTSASALREITIANLGNTPAFLAKGPGSTQTIGNNSNTKVAFAAEDFDTHTAFDTSSNYRFTVPTSCGGTYFFYTELLMGNLDDGKRIVIKWYKNGSALAQQARDMNSADDQETIINDSIIIALAADDYMEVFVNQNNGGDLDMSANYSYFGGFRLTGL